jgi:uncharacterized protein (TIGR03067 family)
MLGRCVLFAALLSLGFAPAPLPRPQHVRTAIDLTRFQGTWKVVGHHQWSGGKKLDNPWSITHIRVQMDRWTLLEAGRENATYRIELNPKQKPCHRLPRYSQRALWLGLIRRDGDTVEIIYLSANRRPEHSRPRRRRHRDHPPAQSLTLGLRLSAASAWRPAQG